MDNWGEDHFHTNQASHSNRHSPFTISKVKWDSAGTMFIETLVASILTRLMQWSQHLSRFLSTLGILFSTSCSELLNLQNWFEKTQKWWKSWTKLAETDNYFLKNKRKNTEYSWIIPTLGKQHIMFSLILRCPTRYNSPARNSAAPRSAATPPSAHTSSPTTPPSGQIPRPIVPLLWPPDCRTSASSAYKSPTHSTAAPRAAADRPPSPGPSPCPAASPRLSHRPARTTPDNSPKSHHPVNLLPHSHSHLPSNPFSYLNLCGKNFFQNFFQNFFFLYQSMH